MLKDTPTAQEAGLPGFVVNSGFGYVGPGGMPRAIVDHFNGALLKTIQDPAVRRSMIDNGADPVGNTPEQHDAYLKSEVAKWLRVGKEAGIKQE
jgi:tripartite-type tricarboxylate transporter receptor subunit TctC